jgi:hypothetical protein
MLPRYEVPQPYSFHRLCQLESAQRVALSQQLSFGLEVLPPLKFFQKLSPISAGDFSSSLLSLTFVLYSYVRTLYGARLTTVVFFYPETKLLSLEEIDLLFTGEDSTAALKIHEGALAEEYNESKMPTQTVEVCP